MPSVRRRRGSRVYPQEEDENSVNGIDTVNGEEEDNDDGLQTSEDDDDEDSPDAHAQATVSVSPDGNFVHQKGSIVRILMKNFVTYTSAEFNCGPSLNMIIGPNGTGKSTLVCAICLGLGWSPNVLGRAKGVGDYVKNGQLEASIEIELKGTADRNIIVKRVIKRAGNKSTWWLNGKERTHKRIKETMAKLKIQVDNLCQFLPQDKVVEFAAMTPVQLLEQTQQAVADPKVSQWHAELKTLGDKQKRLLESKEGRAKALADLTSRQQAQQADVDRMNERQTHEFRKETLMKFRPFFEYKSVKQRSRESKEELYQAKADQKALSNELAPALQTLNNKKDYAERIKAESDNLKSRMTQAKSNISLINSQIIGYKERMKTCDAKIKAETTQQTKKKEELSRCKHALATLERKSKEPPPEFDGVEMNRKIREFEAQIEEMKAQSRELQTVARQKANAFNAKKDEKELIENEIEALQTRSGQLTDKLRKISSDSAKAYAWLQKNKDKFEREVYGPPLVTCSIKKPECADAVESALKRGDFVTFTVTTRKDFLTLQDCLLSNREGCLSLSDITIKQASRPLSAFQRPTDEATLRNLGFDGWLLGALDGPEPVLAMLSENAGLHRTAFTSRPQSEAEFDRVKNSPITRWATKDTLFAVQSRKEYNQTSTTTTALRKARNWVDQPVDTSRQSELKRLVLELEHERETLKEEWNQIKSQNYKLGQEMQDIVTARDNLKDEKDQLQKERSQFENIGRLIDAAKVKLTNCEDQRKDINHRIAETELEKEQHALDRTKAAIQLPATLKLVKRRLQEYVDAQLRLIEAESDVSSFTAQNTSITQQLKNLDKRFEDLKAEYQKLREVVKKLGDVATRMASAMSDEENLIVDNYKNEIGLTITLEDIETEIGVLEQRVVLLGGGNPRVVEEFARRAEQIQTTTARVEEMTQELEKCNVEIADIRGQWEPVLDRVVEQISTAFSWNLEQIGCAGEVEVHKEDDFNLWAIRIKVKFRENEQLSILDSHRQSGGERAVSTIFYLMALQSLARSPFRVVDEINQGMDPRNERMVHERMVDIACSENTSQYFLVTPKLLSGLRYHPRMVVHIIYSGESMPSAEETPEKLDLPQLANLALRVRAQG